MIMYREPEICLEDSRAGLCGIFEVALVCGRAESVGNECRPICEDPNVLAMAIAEPTVSEMYRERSAHIKILGTMTTKPLFSVNPVH